ncbi:MAG: DUF1922 domain-containing protein [Verrucomicrobia bacterium]|nr:DUF1922 domain-containing protein [Verrucomicrobiota bacterium]
MSSEREHGGECRCGRQLFVQSRRILRDTASTREIVPPE